MRNPNYEQAKTITPLMELDTEEFETTKLTYKEIKTLVSLMTTEEFDLLKQAVSDRQFEEEKEENSKVRSLWEY